MHVKRFNRVLKDGLNNGVSVRDGFAKFGLVTTHIIDARCVGLDHWIDAKADREAVGMRPDALQLFDAVGVQEHSGAVGRAVGDFVRTLHGRVKDNALWGAARGAREAHLFPSCGFEPEPALHDVLEHFNMGLGLDRDRMVAVGVCPCRRQRVQLGV
jgi:hypothetical protein